MKTKIESDDTYVRAGEFGSLYVIIVGSGPSMEMDENDGGHKFTFKERYKSERMEGFTEERYLADEKALDELIEKSTKAYVDAMKAGVERSIGVPGRFSLLASTYGGKDEG